MIAALLLSFSIHAIIWDAVEPTPTAPVDFYVVYIGYDPCGPWLKLAEVPEVRWVYLPQNDPLPGEVFFYTVTSGNSAGQGWRAFPNCP